MTAKLGLGADAPASPPAAPMSVPEAGLPGSTDALVERARGGDADAWVVLYRNAFPGLYAFARRRLPSHDDAVDAVNETMARAVAGLGGFQRQEAGFPGWLFGILRNVVRNIQRASNRPMPTAVDVAPQDALEHLVEDEDAAELRAAFAQLGPADRELLELRVVAGLSAEEVGAATGRKAGAVRMAQSRALARLRELMEDGR